MYYVGHQNQVPKIAELGSARVIGYLGSSSLVLSLEAWILCTIRYMLLRHQCNNRSYSASFRHRTGCLTQERISCFRRIIFNLQLKACIVKSIGCSVA